MAVTSVSEIANGASAEETDGIIRATRVFLVEFDTASSTNQVAALFAADGSTAVPAYGDQLNVAITGKPRPKVVSKTAALHDEANSRCIWRVTVSYSSDPSKLSILTDIVSADLPWERDQLVEYDFIERDEELEIDNTTPTPKDVVNAAGDKFDPPIVVSRANGRIIVTRATQSYDFSDAYELFNTINAADVTIDGKTYAAGKLRLLRWVGAETLYTDEDGDETTYYEEVIEIEANADGFDIEKRNEGYNYLSGGNKLATGYFDSAGNWYNHSTPQQLNADGSWPYTSGAKTITFKPYAAAIWTAIGLT